MSEQLRENRIPIPTAIAEEATAWFARRDAHPLTSEEEDAFRRWLAADPMHARAFAKIDILWDEVGGAMAPPAVSAAPVQAVARGARSATIAGALAIAATIAIVAVGLGPMPFARMTADASSTIGEVRTVRLPDGSVAHLNTASAIDVDFTDGRRTVRLAAGEAEFDVAADPARPFTVLAAGGSATALGTVYSVRLDGDAATVTVSESRVRVAFPGDDLPGTRHATLGPGQRVRYGAIGGLEPVAPVNPDTASAWRRGKLIFENRRLADVAAELSRYHRGRIVIVGDDLSRMPVNGVFALDDPAKAARTLGQSLGLRVTSLADFVVVLSR